MLTLLSYNQYAYNTLLSTMVQNLIDFNLAILNIYERLKKVMLTRHRNVSVQKHEQEHVCHCAWVEYCVIQ